MNTFIENANLWGNRFFDFAGPMLWQSGLLIAVVLALDVALRRKIRAAVRYALWLVVLAKLLLPPALALPTGAAWWLRTSKPAAVKTETQKYVVTYDSAPVTTIPIPQNFPAIAPSRPELTGKGWAFLASVFVSAGLLLWLVLRWRQVNRTAQRAIVSEKANLILAEARRLAGVRKPVQVKLTGAAMSPAVCGLFRPVILLPQSLVERLSDEQLRAVLLHELIHLRRGDVWANCIQALLQIVYWWHPLLWIANARIRRVREEAVDDAVMLALRDGSEIYAPTLLEVAKFAFRRPLATLGLVGILESHSALRQRIERLINFRAPRKAGLTIISVLGIIAFTAVAVPMGEAPAKTPSSDRNESALPTNVAGIYWGTNNIPGNIPLIAPVTGILSDTNFRVVLHALEQRTGVEKLAEPEVVTTSGRQVNQMSRNAIEKLTQQSSDTSEAPPPGNDTGKPAQYPQAAHTSPSREVLFHKLNTIHFDQFGPFTATPLNRVIGELRDESLQFDPEKKGVNFLLTGNPNAIQPAIDPNTGVLIRQTNSQPVDMAAIHVTIKPALEHASLSNVLDAIILNSDKPIQYSVQDYGIVFSPRDESPQMEMRVFKVNPFIFATSLQSQPDMESNSVAIMAKDFLKKLGVDLSAPGKSIAFNHRLGLLFVKATPSDLDTIQGAVDELNTTTPQIHLKARFIEVPKGFVVPQMFSNIAANPMIGILSETNFRAILHTLENQSGVETLAEPEVVTTSGRQTQMRETDLEENIITNFTFQEISNRPSIIPQDAKFEIGPTIDLVPQVLADGYTIDLTAIPSVFQFLGYDKTTNVVFVTNSIGKKIQMPTVSPGFRLQEATARVKLWDNQTVVIGNLQNRFISYTNGVQTILKSESKFLSDAERKRGRTDRDLLVFVTATIVDPAGNRVHSDDNHLPFNPNTIPPQQ